jgi:peptidoglycan/LPS O-acetylase OafA/YrhL
MKTERTLVRVPALDGIRGLAALAVFVPHYLNQWSIRDAHANFGPILRTVYDFRDLGRFGVDVFFILSGFLISSLLIADRESPSFFRDFYWKRALRILPVYLVHLLATLLLYPRSGGYVVLCLLFVVNFASPLHVNAPGQAWTLSIEEQFYLLWPQAIRRLQPKSLYYLAFALVLSANALRILVPLWHGGANERFTFYRTDGLALGALVAFERFLPLANDRKIKGALGFLQSNWTLLGAFAIALAVSALQGHSVISRQVTLSTVNLLFYRIIRVVVYHERKGLGWLGSVPLVYLGSISYALYMYQGFVINSFNRIFGLIPASPERMVLLRAVLVLLACFAVCTLSRYALELPVQRLRRFVLRSRQVPSIDVQATHAKNRSLKAEGR